MFAIGLLDGKKGGCGLFGLYCGVEGDVGGLFIEDDCHVAGDLLGYLLDAL